MDHQFVSWEIFEGTGQVPTMRENLRHDVCLACNFNSARDSAVNRTEQRWTASVCRWHNTSWHAPICDSAHATLVSFGLTLVWCWSDFVSWLVYSQQLEPCSVQCFSIQSWKGTAVNFILGYSQSSSKKLSVSHNFKTVSLPWVVNPSETQVLRTQSPKFKCSCAHDSGYSNIQTYSNTDTQIDHVGAFFFLHRIDSRSSSSWYWANLRYSAESFYWAVYFWKFRTRVGTFHSKNHSRGKRCQLSVRRKSGLERSWNSVVGIRSLDWLFRHIQYIDDYSDYSD